MSTMAPPLDPSPPAPGNSDVFQAIADPTRRRILEILAAGERPVKELLGAFTMRQPSLSQHLRILRDVHLVSVRKDGRLRIYSLEAERLKDVAEWTAAFGRFWDVKLDALSRFMDAQETAKERENSDAEEAT